MRWIVACVASTADCAATTFDLAWPIAACAAAACASAAATAGLGSLLLGFALGHLALRGLDADERTSQLRLGLLKLRLQDSCIHFRQDLAGADELTLVDHDLPDPTRGLGCDINLDRLDPAVTGGESVGQVLRLKMPPSPNAQSNNNRSGDASNTCFNELFHVLDIPHQLVYSF